MLSMESQTKTQQNPGNAQVIPNQNPPGPVCTEQWDPSGRASTLPQQSVHSCVIDGRHVGECPLRQSNANRSAHAEVLPAVALPFPLPRLALANNEAMDAGDDWRAYLQTEARIRIVNKIMVTLRKHLPVSMPEAEGQVELQRIAVRFEEKVYAAATNQSDYLGTISLKMLSMESKAKTQQNPAPGSSSKGKKEKKLRCHFCKKGGHFKKVCLKRKIWFDKKGVAYDPNHKRTKAHENKNDGTLLKELGLAE